jgi:hypothetical protein
MLNIRAVIILSTAVLLSACGGSSNKKLDSAYDSAYRIRAGVIIHYNSFANTAHPMKSTATFAIYTPKERANDLEFTEYSALITKFLRRDGWKPTEIRQADYVVVLNYAADDGRTELRSYSVPVYGLVGGGTTFHSGTVYSDGAMASYSGTSTSSPTIGIVGSKQRTKVVEVFTRHVTIDVINRSESEKQKQTVVDWSVKMRSEGREPYITPIMPFFVETALGVLGETTTGSKALRSISDFAVSQDDARKRIARFSPDEHGNLLILAIQKGDQVTALSLLQMGVDPNTHGGKKDRPALHWAAYHNRARVVDELVRQGATIDDEALRYARRSMGREAEERLLAAQAANQKAK